MKSSITHTAVLGEAILDTQVTYVEAVQNHNPPVAHGAFGKLLVIVLVSGRTMIHGAEGLEFVT